MVAIMFMHLHYSGHNSSPRGPIGSILGSNESPLREQRDGRAAAGPGRATTTIAAAEHISNNAGINPKHAGAVANQMF
jgi:hypothetical protein